MDLVGLGYGVGMTSKTAGDDEAVPRKQLGFLVEYVNELLNETVPDAPVSRSRLYGADAKLGSFPLTHNVVRNLSVSGDHLRALCLLLETAQAQLPYASFTLLRGSLEVTGQGLWLLGAGTRVEMIRRNLIVEWQNMWDRQTAFSSGHPDTERRQKLLKEIADSVDGLGLTLGKRAVYRSTDAVREGGRAYGFDDLFLAAWRGTSGIAHGRSWAALGLLDRVEVPGTRGADGAKYEMTSNTETLAGLFFVAVLGHEVLLRCFAESLAARSANQPATARAVYVRLRGGFDS